MNTTSKISNQAQALEKAFEQIQAYRQFWSSSLKPFLIEKLTYYTTSELKGFNVQSNKTWENLESVSLVMTDRPSGIQEKEFDHVRNFAMKGGYLHFSQTTNGRIVLLVIYPSIEDFTSQKPPKQLHFYNPKEVTEEIIEEAVLLFLTEMVEWIRNEDQPVNPIGFTTKQ